MFALVLDQPRLSVSQAIIPLVFRTMGAARFWEILSNGYGVDVAPVKLPTYATTRGFLENAGNVRAVRIAVDARGILHRAGYAGGKFSSVIADRGCIFNLVCAFRRIPMLPLFVFDGAGRCGVKRGRKVTGSPHNLEESMQDLLDAFGMAWARPDGEADRELSFISKYGMADCVLTDDNDAWPHGIPCVYRPAVSISGQKSSSVDKYFDGTLYTVNNSKSVFDYIFLSACLGSDGDAGIPGVGPALAEILSTFQHHVALIQSVRQSSEDYKASQAIFHTAMTASCSSHPSGRVRAIAIPTDFPSKAIIERYLTDAPGDLTGQHQSQSPDYSTPPRLSLISRWMAANLTGCRDIKKLYKRIVQQLLPALVLRQLTLEVMGYDNNLENVAPFAHQLVLAATGLQSVDEVQLLVSMPESMVAEMVSGATKGQLPRNAGRTKVWILHNIYAEVLRLRALHDTNVSDELSVGADDNGRESEEGKGREWVGIEDSIVSVEPSAAAEDNTDSGSDLPNIEELIRPLKRRKMSTVAVTADTLRVGWARLSAMDGSHLGWMKINVLDDGTEVIDVE